MIVASRIVNALKDAGFYAFAVPFGNITEVQARVNRKPIRVATITAAGVQVNGNLPAYMRSVIEAAAGGAK